MFWKKLPTFDIIHSFLDTQYVLCNSQGNKENANETNIEKKQQQTPPHP